MSIQRRRELANVRVGRVVSRNINDVVNETLLRQVFSDLDVLRGLFKKSHSKYNGDTILSDPLIHSHMLHRNNFTASTMELMEGGIIYRSYTTDGDDITTVYMPRGDYKTAVLVALNNYLRRRGYDEQYMVKEITDEISTIFNECFMNRKSDI